MAQNEAVNTGVASSEVAERAALRHALVDLEHTRERIREHAEQVYDATRRDLVAQLLPVLDNLDRAVEAADAASDRSLVDGVRIVRAELETVLFKYGVERVDAIGQRFNPALHEAITAVPVLDPARVGSVMLQAAPGYRLGDKLLRPAKVGVGVQG